LLRDPENKLGVNESYMSNMAIIVAAVGHKGPKLLEKGVVGEVLLAGARESSRNSAGARKLNSLGALFFFGAVRGRSLALVDVHLSCRL
jgi:hypothetical protein